MVEKNKPKSKYLNSFDVVLICLLVSCVLMIGVSVLTLIIKE